MVAIEHPEAIERRRQLISTDVLDPEEVYEDCSIDGDGATSYEEDDIGLGEAGARTGVIEVGTKEVEEVQQHVKYSSLSSYMFKPPSLLAPVFK